MRIVVAYDIVDNRRRNKIAKTMLDYGFRVQKSVFECLIDDRKYLSMKEKIEKLIDPTEDSVRYYFLCARCENSTEVSGSGPIHDDEDVIIV
jgi:CRISPR-associated protein Cas2